MEKKRARKNMVEWGIWWRICWGDLERVDRMRGRRMMREDMLRKKLAFWGGMVWCSIIILVVMMSRTLKKDERRL